MKVARYIALAFLTTLLLQSCEKNTVSKIPYISLIAFVPDTSILVNVDTTYIVFEFTDGDGDIGYGANKAASDTISRVYVKDSRYATQGYVPYDFPAIDITIEDPKKGLQGKCTFFPVPQPTPRLDSLHMAMGDTLYYEFYIEDRAGHQSNHLITHSLVIRV